MNVYKYLILLLHLLLVVACHEESVQAVPLERVKKGSSLYCPVTINGHSFRFLIDTGCECTCMEYSRAKEAGILPTDSCKKDFFLFDKDWSGMSYFCQTRIGVGCMSVVDNLFFYNYPNSLSISDNAGADGILGMDILSHWNWCMDLKNDSLWFSSRGRDFPVKGEASLTLDVLQLGIYAHILLPDSTRQLLQLDTGCSMFAGLYDYSFSSGVVLSDSLLHEL